ncbi:hypothetical protein TM7_0608 [candidate division TM7 genomosp. GTL1]|nr:hypothetical protein TM7_0608 [candidate division TM7 genomosp. GTL1]
MKNRLISLLKSKRTRAIASAFVLVASAALFIVYALQHPELIGQIMKIGPVNALLIVVLYFIFILTTAAILTINVRMCRTAIERREGFLLTAYSTIVNFFGPLQSGPGFRAVYLKKQLHIKLRDYGLVTILSYLFFAFFSGLLLISGLLPWQALVLLSFIGAAGIWLIWRYRKQIPKLKDLQMAGKAKLFAALAVATIVQIVLNAVIYFIELHAVDPAISFGQALIYTGAANFALFAALTPGSIGIRESFLLFSQNLHGIDSQTVLAASVIDRALYFVFLGALFLLITSMHAQKKLKVSKVEKST